MPFMLSSKDIIDLEVDAVVSSTDVFLSDGGGVSKRIFQEAGRDKLISACKKYIPIRTGEAVITDGFNLKSDYIIHTAGPIYKNYSQEKARDFLRNCYLNCLDLAIKNNCQSIAFPLISAGSFGFPKMDALSIATSTILDFLKDYDLDVYLVLYEKIYSNQRRDNGRLEHFIRENLEFENLYSKDFKIYHENSSYFDYNSDEEICFKVAESFSEYLFKIIMDRQIDEVKLYKRANLDRKLFSKIRKKDYKPAKKTAIALALALKLSFEETQDLLMRAGYFISDSILFDVIIKYFILQGKYDIYEINEVLFNYDLPVIGN